MHYLVTITPSIEAADALDRAPGGPGPLFQFINDRYKPVLFWVAAGHRSASWIVDLTDAAQLHELVHIAAAKARAVPEFTPVVLGEDAGRSIAAAAAVAMQAP